VCRYVPELKLNPGFAMHGHSIPPFKVMMQPHIRFVLIFRRCAEPVEAANGLCTPRSKPEGPFWRGVTCVIALVRMLQPVWPIMLLCWLGQAQSTPIMMDIFFDGGQLSVFATSCSAFGPN
jgi:hypothetical protein